MVKSFIRPSNLAKRNKMKTLLAMSLLTLALSLSVSAQNKMDGMSMEPTEADKTAAIPTSGYLKRGEPLGKSEKVQLAKVLEDPSKFAGKTVQIEGVIVRSCTMEGCWAEI